MCGKFWARTSLTEVINFCLYFGMQCSSFIRRGDTPSGEFIISGVDIFVVNTGSLVFQYDDFVREMRSAVGCVYDVYRERFSALSTQEVLHLKAVSWIRSVKSHLLVPFTRFSNPSG